MHTGFPSNGHDFQGKHTGPHHFAMCWSFRTVDSYSVDEFVTQGVNSGMRCPMQTGKTIAVDSKSSESCTSLDPRVEFMIGASLHEDYAETDFVHSIVGRIFAKVERDAEEKEAGCVKASLVQFGEAMDHGITTERLGDGVDGNIAEYWELLFDLDSGYWKEEIRDEYEALGCDLLIIDCIEVHPKLRGRGIGRSVVDRTIDIFGAGCGLVACRPWPLQFTPSYTRDRKALKRLRAPSVGRDDAIHKLRAYWSRLGFWPLGESGIYLLSMTQRGSSEAPKKCETFAASLSGLTSRRVC
jgi:GNAT superfamily N-acetyltransferase